MANAGLVPEHHTEERTYRIGDRKYHVDLHVALDRRTSTLNYSIKTSSGYDTFKFVNSRPETVRKVADLMKSAMAVLLKVCTETGCKIKGLSALDSETSNGVQGDAPRSASDDL